MGILREINYCQRHQCNFLLFCESLSLVRVGPSLTYTNLQLYFQALFYAHPTKTVKEYTEGYTVVSRQWKTKAKKKKKSGQLQQKGYLQGEDQNFEKKRTNSYKKRTNSYTACFLYVSITLNIC